MNKLDFYLFHLMPYPYIPPGEEIESTWVTLPNSHYDPKVGHRLYNEYLEQLIAGERLGYDGVCVNEHHQNAYGTMPSPDIMAAYLDREDRAHPDRHHRQRAAAAREPGPRGRGDRDARRDLGRAHHLGLRARHRHGVLLLRRQPELLAGALLGGARPDHQGVDRAGAVPLAGQALQPAVREPVAAAAAAAAPAGLAAGLGLDGDDQEGGRAALPVHDGVRAAVVHEGELRHVPACGRGGRLRGVAEAARGGDPDLRRRDRGAGAPRGEAAHDVAVPERAEDPALPLVPARLHEQEVVRRACSARRSSTT